MAKSVLMEKVKPTPEAKSSNQTAPGGLEGWVGLQNYMSLHVSILLNVYNKAYIVFLAIKKH